jgi:alpha-galactosidase
MGGRQMQQTPDVLISVGTKNTDLIYRVNSRDGRLYQANLGNKLSNIENLQQVRDPGHPAYATFGTDNLFERAIRITHNDGNPSLELKYLMAIGLSIGTASPLTSTVYEISE